MYYNQIRGLSKSGLGSGSGAKINRFILAGTLLKADTDPDPDIFKGFETTSSARTNMLRDLIH